MANEYVTWSDMKVPLGIGDSTDDTWGGIIATEASRAIDIWCGRRFYADTNATARVYYPASPCHVHPDDISETTSLVVKTDDGGDGTFGTTWSTTDYQVEPLNGVRFNVTGWPYDTIRAIAGRTFPCRNARASVQITAKWGYAATPENIKTAAYILGAELFKRKDAPFGIAGVGDLGVARIREDTRVQSLLIPYRRDHGIAG